MNTKLTHFLLTFMLLSTSSWPVQAQNSYALGFEVRRGVVPKGILMLPHEAPLVTFKLREELVTTAGSSEVNDSTMLVDGRIEVVWKRVPFEHGIKVLLKFRNTTPDTLTLHNIVPFGESADHVYITGKGDHGLSRTHLFRPGREPVNVIVPDNAWELGFAAIQTANGQGVCALSRRDRASIQKGTRRRFETILYPGGSVGYNVWIDMFHGEWQGALKLMFQERFLYDVPVGSFDNSLFERDDLKWFRHCYAFNLVYSWDTRYYYDGQINAFKVDQHLKNMNRLIGGYEVYSIWPTWPTLGLDQRNQWDLFKDLPGGLKGIREISDVCNRNGSNLFICYNPWDESTTYNEGHYKGMAAIIAATNASGVVLDTRSESNREMQNEVDQVRKGVIMYSEGMAVPRDMQGIPSGRVHNALYYPPLLNLNKFIKPDFAIFRVAEDCKERIRREFCLSLLNGYGTEINNMPAGKPEWVEEQYRFWGDILRIQRENSSCFTSFDYTPLVETTTDKVYVNQWATPHKTVYTILSLIPAGFKGDLFSVADKPGYHYIDLYNYEEINPNRKADALYIPASLASFNQHDLGTNNEGSPGAIGCFPKLLNVQLNACNDLLTFSAPKGSTIRVWAGKPAYNREAREFGVENNTIKLLDCFPGHEGKLVVQLFEGTELLDQRILHIEYGTPRKISRTNITAKTAKAPAGMVEIPSGYFQCDEYITGDSFIRYPNSPTSKGERIAIPKFYMDRYPVTNTQFKSFIDATGYQPADTCNFLKNWGKSRSIPKGMENYPVVYVSYEDAQAYAAWAEKRLPTEVEWQYAAQTTKGNRWPWVQKSPVRRVEEEITPTLSVFRLEGIEPNRCNLGDGKMYPVGAFPKGRNPYGLEDLVGSVWQLTHDVYDNTSHRFIIIRGGSYFLPSSSWWYVQGGPRELNYRQYLLRVSQGFERNATVGFRCVKDALQ